LIEEILIRNWEMLEKFKSNDALKKVLKGEIQNILKQRNIKLVNIILFGSRVRGDYQENSDWDLLFVVEENLPREEKVKIAHFIIRALAEHYIPCDVLIKSAEELEERKEVIGSIIRTAVREGISL